jgi:glycosyltransferase involved in cell wall biosynthesis
MSRPSVSIVIPARNEAGTIAVCLASILAQEYSDFEVLVVDGASTDQTANIVREYAQRDSRIRLLENRDRSIAKSLNIALAEAQGEWLVRIDAHAHVPQNYIGLAVAHLATGEWGGVGGRKDGIGETNSGRAIAAALGSRFGVGDSRYHYATSSYVADHIPYGCYATDLCRRIGGWNERLEANEDYEFDYRLRQAGHRLLLDPALRISWRSRQSLRDLFRQYHRYGRGKAAMVKLHPTSIRARHLAPPLLIVNLGSAALLVPFSRRRARLLWAPYLAALAAATVGTRRRVDGLSARAAIPAAFAVMHIAWGLGFWRGLLSPALRRGPRTARPQDPARGRR